MNHMFEIPEYRHGSLQHRREVFRRQRMRGDPAWEYGSSTSGDQEALGEGITTGHPSMPEFKLDPGQVGDFISFLKSLEQ